MPFPTWSRRSARPPCSTELLVAREGEVAPFADLQQRLNRKRVDPALLRGFPAHVRPYDILFDGEEDLRALPLIERRARLEGWYEAHRPECMDLSPLIAFATWGALASLRHRSAELCLGKEFVR